MPPAPAREPRAGDGRDRAAAPVSREAEESVITSGRSDDEELATTTRGSQAERIRRHGASKLQNYNQRK